MLFPLSWTHYTLGLVCWNKSQPHFSFCWSLSETFFIGACPFPWTLFYFRSEIMDLAFISRRNSVRKLIAMNVLTKQVLQIRSTTLLFMLCNEQARHPTSHYVAQRWYCSLFNEKYSSQFWFRSPWFSVWRINRLNIAIRDWSRRPSFPNTLNLNFTAANFKLAQFGLQQQLFKHKIYLTSDKFQRDYIF